LHWIPQLPLPQVAAPFAGAAQGEQEVPQLCGLESAAHAPLHRCAPASHEVSTQPPTSELHTPCPPENAVVQSTALRPQAVSVSPAQSVPCTCWPAGQSQRLFTHRVDAQSLPLPQRSVAAQGPQVPPQSTSLSPPFFVPSVQVGCTEAAWHTPFTQASPFLQGLLVSSQMESGDAPQPNAKRRSAPTAARINVLLASSS
jgi:hypothetical protein